jgi:hypothetical protein
MNFASWNLLLDANKNWVDYLLSDFQPSEISPSQEITLPVKRLQATTVSSDGALIKESLAGAEEDQTPSSALKQP